MIRLYLLRHGEAGFDAPTDQARTLTENGKDVVRRVSGFVDAVDIMAVSPVCRAQETADILTEKVRVNRRIKSDTLIPDGKVADVISWLESCDSDVTILVTHNPLITSLAHWLTGQDNLSFSPGSLACLTGDIIGPGCLTVSWLK